MVDAILRRAFICSFAFCGLCTEAFAESEADLTAQFSPDRSSYVELSTKIKADSKSPMGDFNMTFAINSGTLTDISAHGDGAKIAMTIDRAAMTFDSNMGPSFFDSDIPDEEQSVQWEQILAPQVGMTIGIELDANDKVAACAGMEAIVKKIDERASENMFWDYEKPKYNCDRYKAQWHNQVLSIFPGKKVKVGESWSAPYAEDAAELKDFGFKCKYTLKFVSEKDGRKLAEIEFEGKIAEGDDKFEAEGMMPISNIKFEKAALSGTATIDVDRGELVRREDHVEVAYSGTMGQGENGPGVSTSREIDRKYVVQTLAYRQAEKEENARIAAEKRRKAEVAEAQRRSRFANAKEVEVSTKMRPNPLGDDATWPQWGGPHGDFKAESSGLAESWPEGGPKKVWNRELGDGYSSIVSDGGRLYTMYRPVDEEKNKTDEIVVALDPETGSTIWEYKYEAPFVDGTEISFGRGPHSTPLIVGDRLFTVGSMVHLHCLDKNTGEVIWKHDLLKELGASHMMYGYGASALAYQDKIIVPIGGKGQAVVAFNQSDGSIAWKYQDFGPTHASVFVVIQGDVEQLVLFAAGEVAGINAANGQVNWRVEHTTEWGANISTPVWGEDGWLFISSAYGMGSRGIKLSIEDGTPVANEKWHNNKMKIHHGNAVRVGNFVYGSSGDFGPVFYAAVDIETGELAWRNRDVGKALSLYADGKMFILNESGTLHLAKVSPAGLNIISKTQVSDGRTWTVPTLVGKRLYIRDRKNITALDLG
jgi:outer membrane protein assembly factor BamB